MADNNGRSWETWYWMIVSISLAIVIGIALIALGDRKDEIAVLVARVQSGECSDKNRQDADDCCKAACVWSGKYYTYDENDHRGICREICLFGKEQEP